MVCVVRMCEGEGERSREADMICVLVEVRAWVCERERGLKVRLFCVVDSYVAILASVFRANNEVERRGSEGRGNSTAPVKLWQPLDEEMELMCT